MTAMAYRLPMPPSVNAIWRKRNGRMVKSDRYKTWQRAAMNELLTQPRQKVSGPVHIDISLPVDKRNSRRRDLDNHAKAVIDLLVTMGLMDDDKHVDSLFMAWEPVPDCTVRVMPFEEDAAAQGRAA